MSRHWSGAAVLLVALLAGASPAGAVTFTVTNTNNSGAGSLRQAILDANVTAVADTVAFNIPGAGGHTISPTSELPAIANPLTINGSTEPGFSGSPLIQLDGTSAGAGSDGLRVLAGANASVIRALAINRFGRHGIQLLADGGAVRGCVIGVSPNGIIGLPNGRDGVSIGAGAANNTIGGTTAAERNLLSDNTRAGVFITGAGATGNLIRGNLIGTDGSGASARSNQIGVWIAGGATGNTVGGSSAGQGNFISGNDGPGVMIAGPATTGNVVRGNTIGMDDSGTSSLPNGTGVLIGAAANGNTVGGTAGQGNVISFNDFDGVTVEGTDTRTNTLRGNVIGLSPGGIAAPNGKHGVNLRDEARDNAVAENVISGNTAAGVHVTGEGTSGNDVRANKIGTNAAGTADLGNDIGVHVRGGATATDVFGGNVISGNDVRGVDVGDEGTSGTVVRGNLIGLNAAGTSAIPNPNGIFLHAGSTATRIGGTTAADRNVISGNGSRGIEVSINTTGNSIRGNYIGLNAAGTSPVPNITGVILLAGAVGTTIGGTEAGAGNVISGNSTNGVFVGDSTSTGTVIQGNRIGTNAAGTAAAGNSENGLIIAQGAQDVLVGGTSSAARNVISGNVESGVAVTGSATNIRIQGNFIGTDASGTGALANEQHGVAVAGGAHDNAIGGKTAAAGNLIAHNGSDGVLIGSNADLTTPAAAGNAVLGNRIHSNGGLAIDLGPNDGETGNDGDDFDTGPNNMLNFPVLDVAVSGGGTFVSGTYDGPASRTLRLEFFADPNPDPSGNGEGRTFLGARTLTTDSSGVADFHYLFAADVNPGTAVSATATETLTGNTSEFGIAAVAD